MLCSQGCAFGSQAKKRAEEEPLVPKGPRGSAKGEASAPMNNHTPLAVSFESAANAQQNNASDA